MSKSTGESPSIKAIETVYADCRFRSRLEARWAVFFDAMEEPWVYEKQGYKLSSGRCYLPDFWLPKQQMWVEVKGNPEDHDSFLLCQQFAKEQSLLTLWCCGLPGEELGALFSPGGRIAMVELRSSVVGDLILVPTRFMGAGKATEDALEVIAKRKAKSARFEFGERG